MTLLPRFRGNGRKRATDSEEALAELRDILVGDEVERIEKLETRGVTDEAIAKALPEAIRKREQQDDSVARALGPTMEAALFRSARKDPQALADAIYPALGPAIRSMIQASLRQSMESLNVALENSLTPQGLRWRMTAARTGKSFSEVVLLETLVFRVEQVLLVQRDSGLIMGEALDPAVAAQDSDLVAGMLSAIRDFAQDSFGASPEDSPLEEIEFSDLTLILAQGPEAILALVVRGNPPRNLHERAVEAVEDLHVEYGEELRAFGGGEDELAVLAPRLEDLLETESKVRKKSAVMQAVPMIVGALLLAWLAVSTWRSVTARADLRRVEKALSSVEGVVLTDGYLEDTSVVIEGLRDPLSAPIDRVVRDALGSKWRTVELRLQPFQSFEPKLHAARLRRALSTPLDVELTVEGSVLYLSGKGASEELAKAYRSESLGLLGIEYVHLRP